MEDPNDAVAMKRGRNTLAARKSRKRKLQKLEEAAEQCSKEIGAAPKLQQTSNSFFKLVPATTSEVEDFTIKYICKSNEDDGATIYCESCDTWQHIECFYPGQTEKASRGDFDHSCADCKPRPLGRQRTIDYQQNQRQWQLKLRAEPNEARLRRPSSKSHKKKLRPSDLQMNGQIEELTVDLPLYGAVNAFVQKLYRSLPHRTSHIRLH